MNHKFIIEIEEVPFIQRTALNGERELWKAKGFNSLVFDQNGLEKLKPLTDDYCIERAKQTGWFQKYICDMYDNWESKSSTEAFDEGAEFGWNMAFEISNLEDSQLEAAGIRGDFNKLTCKEAVDKYDAYLVKQSHDLQIGDVVEDEKSERYLVVDIKEHSYVCMSGRDFETAYFGKKCDGLTKVPHESKDMDKIKEMFEGKE